jgi:enoyl-CoA hydratase
MGNTPEGKGTGYETLLYDKTDGVVIITMNRPHRLNAMSAQLFLELQDAYQRLAVDDEVRVVIVTGARRADGSPCFSAGADLKEIHSKGGYAAAGVKGKVGVIDEVEWMARVNLGTTGFSIVEDTMKPTIAAIDGICTAGGIELAAACDFRFASETAEISDMHIKNLGLIGGAGITARLPLIVGAQRAKEIVFLGEPMNGVEAVRCGFALKVFPPDELMEGALDFARRIAAMDPIGIRMAKASINASLEMNRKQALEFSRLCLSAHAPPDGLDAFVGR